jgi:hypothetical protein
MGQMRKPTLKDIHLDMSATCSACGAVFFTRGLDAGTNPADNVKASLTQIFERHVAERHLVPKERTV